MKYILLLLCVNSIFSFTFPSYQLLKTSTLRELLDDNIKKKICSNMIENYKTVKETSLQTYVKKLGFEQNGSYQLAMSLLTEGKVDGVSELIQDVVIYVAMIVLAGIILLSK